MVDIPEIKAEEGNSIETWVGLCVVILATFLGICNIKDDNIVQQMQLQQADRNDNWSWYQARKIRISVFESFIEELSIPRPNETPEITAARLERIEKFRKKIEQQKEEAKQQQLDAEKAREEYFRLNSKDDQFDLCEAALAIGLALMGVTALVKRYWMFFIALVPSVFGIVMGVAGFLGIDTSNRVIDGIIKILS